MPKCQENPGPLTTQNPLGHCGLLCDTIHYFTYSKISHRICICQKLGTLEINALGPHATSAEVWLTVYKLPDLWIGNNEKKYRSYCQESERELIWCNAYYNFVHNALLSCYLS